MMHLDRKIAPRVKSIESIDFPEVEFHSLKNGIPVYIMNSGTQDIVKLDILVEAGQWFSDNIMIPFYCNRMLMEGSKKYSHAEIAEKLDYYGTFSNFECGKHFAHIQLFTLTNFFKQSVEIFEDFVKKPVFPEDKLKVMVQNDMQQFVVSREKTEVLAADEFFPRIFGNNHPYGKVRKLEHFENISLEQIKQFHQRYYNATNCIIMVSGKLDQQVKNVLQSHFGESDWTGLKANPGPGAFVDSIPGRYNVHKAGAFQSSLLIGKRTINKLHEDYFGLSILNTILGGYFGSRLMTNLREKSALTYGIYSGLMSMLHAGTFTISANVNGNESEKAVSQIYKELRILKEEKVSDDELQMVKNYLAGDMLRTFDGPLALSEIFLDLLAYNLDYEHYQNYFKTLKSITSEKLRELANIYLDEDSFIEVIAGDIKN
jgi:zinc protease